MESMPISKFKATCPAVLEGVRRTGKPVLITKRGVPIAEVVPAGKARETGRQLGSLSGSGRITGDLVSPILEERDWAAVRDEASA